MVARSSTPSTRNISRESRLPTPRSSGALNTSLTVNVKSAQSKSPSNLVGRNLQLCKPPPAPLTNQTNQTNQTPSARRLIAYGSQRSATTSIVPSQSQIKAALFHNKNQVQKCAQKTKAMPRAATNQSINRAASPATHQIGSALSPRSHSPTQLIAHLSSKISPAGVGRERSSSPVNKLGSQSNLSHGSNSNLQTIAETRIPAHLNSPAMNRKMTSQVKARRSFLPQPAQSTVANRQSSISPSRTRNVSPADWKDGCY
ncbi:hypothetical protein BpHYR1_031253 [Brachionus plicatilis]|uniref:Uncharacterized protein n=1 Tax=Brachionus plicatilis TaxID=10195 RepID=A0A3M7RZQ6_BRAPC|nr:hypothetical protein BpHYR1_031253 [Brachionus plicatilis]